MAANVRAGAKARLNPCDYARAAFDYLAPMRIYRLSFGTEGMDPIEGTEDELCAILDDYPELMVLELFQAEKRAGGEVASVLLRYVARRFVDGFEDGE
jgi:hypothetical protein